MGYAVALQRARQAEGVGGYVRPLVVAIVGVTWLLSGRRAVIPWFAEVVLLAGAAYAVGILLLRPHERWPSLLTSYVTTAIDSSWILAFVIATGGASSPYVTLFFVSIAAVAFRYGLDETLAMAAIYVAFYVGLAWLMDDIVATAEWVAISSGGILVVALQTGLLARAMARETAAREESMGQLREAMRQLEEHDRARTRILNHVSHEIRTPITPMKLQIHMLQLPGADPLSPRQLKALGVLERSVAHIEHVTQEALDSSKLRAGGLGLRRERVDVASLAREVAHALEPAARKAGVELEVQVDPELGSDVDAARLRQAMEHMVQNAIKFTPSGGHVALRAHKEGDSIRFEVQDDGRGIAPADLSRLFQPFAQVGDAVREEVGQGLGLFIARGIVEEHGGRVLAHSDGPGKGARFGFTLPMR